MKRLVVEVSRRPHNPRRLSDKAAEGWRRKHSRWVLWVIGTYRHGILNYSLAYPKTADVKEFSLESSKRKKWYRCSYLEAWRCISNKDWIIDIFTGKQGKLRFTASICSPAVYVHPQMRVNIYTTTDIAVDCLIRMTENIELSK